MKAYICLLLLIGSITLSAQTEKSFAVKKKPTAKSQKEQEYSWAFLYRNYLQVDSKYRFNLAPVINRFDSVSALNVRIVRDATFIYVITGSSGTDAALVFYKYDTNGKPVPVHIQKYIVTRNTKLSGMLP